MAARRLAAGDQTVVAAASAGVNTHTLRLLLAEDPDFSALVDAFRELKALPPEAKRARLEDLCWDGAERAVLDGRVSTLNLCLRTLRLIETEEDEDEEEDPMAAFLAGLSPEERADYDALDEVEEPEAMLATPMPAPSDEEAPSPSPRHGWPGQAGPRQEGESDLPTAPPPPKPRGEETGLSTGLTHKGS
jgi:hypothetical protein